jgi:hypothetical protein
VFFRTGFSERMFCMIISSSSTHLLYLKKTDVGCLLMHSQTTITANYMNYPKFESHYVQKNVEKILFLCRPFSMYLHCTHVAGLGTTKSDSNTRQVLIHHTMYQ